MKKLFAGTALCSLLMAATVVVAQDVKKCATDELIHSIIAKDPSAQAKLDAYEKDVQQRAAILATEQANNATQKTTASKYSIALAFHVVLTQAQLDQIGGTQGLYNRVVSQIEVLNTDFNAQNTDAIPSAFASLKGNPDMSFGLAHTKPDGSGTIGIEILIKPAGFTGYEQTDNSLKRTSAGGLDPWDNSRYLNIWITNITTSSGGEILGYAYNPKLASVMLGDPGLMGVVVDFLAFGKRSSVVQQFFVNADKGRTMVHEFGHFFTLNHIWGNTSVGNGNCNDDDGVDDTPRQSDANQSNCPTFPKASCINANPGEMFMNYMDYVYDACMAMFSKGQVTRMQSEFVTGGGSINLPKNINLFSWPSGVENVSMTNEIDVVPNPSNGIFTITYGNGLKQVTINNMLGQVVKQIPVTNQQSGTMSVNIIDAGKGMYTIQCLYNEGIVSKKVIVQ